MMASEVGRGGYKDVSTVKRLNSFIFTYLINFFNTKTGFQGLVVARISRMSEFNSKFGGQLRCQGIHSFLHTLIPRLQQKSKRSFDVFRCDCYTVQIMKPHLS